MLYFLALCNNVRCVEYAECQNGQCVCKEGYHGNGRIKCEGLFTIHTVVLLFQKNWTAALTLWLVTSQF